MKESWDKNEKPFQISVIYSILGSLLKRLKQKYEVEAPRIDSYLDALCQWFTTAISFGAALESWLRAIQRIQPWMNLEDVNERWRWRLKVRSQFQTLPFPSGFPEPVDLYRFIMQKISQQVKNPCWFTFSVLYLAPAVMESEIGREYEWKHGA